MSLNLFFFLSKCTIFTTFNTNLVILLQLLFSLLEGNYFFTENVSKPHFVLYMSGFSARFFFSPLTSVNH